MAGAVVTIAQLVEDLPPALVVQIAGEVVDLREQLLHGAGGALGPTENVLDVAAFLGHSLPQVDPFAGYRRQRAPRGSARRNRYTAQKIAPVLFVLVAEATST